MPCSCRPAWSTGSSGSPPISPPGSCSTGRRGASGRDPHPRACAMSLRLVDRLQWGARTYVMGILNITPDSFSGDGLIRGEDWVSRAVEQGMTQVADGAHILDIGGESTRPRAVPIPVPQAIPA